MAHGQPGHEPVLPVASAFTPYATAGPAEQADHRARPVAGPCAPVRSRRRSRGSAARIASHRIDVDAVALLEQVVEGWPARPATLVPTHGDWQPRNWLVHDGLVSVIDFGRAAVRSALTDLGRLDAQQFRVDRGLEQAFLGGYGTDPREPDAWLRLRIHDAVATAGWAFKVGDEAYEQQGRRMVGEVVAELLG